MHRPRQRPRWRNQAAQLHAKGVGPACRQSSAGARQQSADSLGESEGDATPAGTRDRIGQGARSPGLRETAGGELFPKPLKDDDCCQSQASSSSTVLSQQTISQAMLTDIRLSQKRLGQMSFLGRYCCKSRRGSACEQKCATIESGRTNS